MEYKVRWGETERIPLVSGDRTVGDPDWIGALQRSLVVNHL